MTVSPMARPEPDSAARDHGSLGQRPPGPHRRGARGASHEAFLVMRMRFCPLPTADAPLPLRSGGAQCRARVGTSLLFRRCSRQCLAVEIERVKLHGLGAVHLPSKSPPRRPPAPPALLCRKLCVVLRLVPVPEWLPRRSLTARKRIRCGGGRQGEGGHPLRARDGLPRAGPVPVGRLRLGVHRALPQVRCNPPPPLRLPRRSDVARGVCVQ